MVAIDLSFYIIAIYGEVLKKNRVFIKSLEIFSSTFVKSHGFYGMI